MYARRKNFEDVRCSIFQRIGERCALALKYKLYGEDANKFSVGGQCFIYESLLAKARVCDDGSIGVVLKHYISEGIEAIFHLGCNANTFTEGNYKFGLGWSLYCWLPKCKTLNLSKSYLLIRNKNNNICIIKLSM